MNPIITGARMSDGRLGPLDDQREQDAQQERAAEVDHESADGEGAAEPARERVVHEVTTDGSGGASGGDEQVDDRLVASAACAIVPAIGSATKKVEPRPSSLSNQMRPRCASAIWRAMARPRPSAALSTLPCSVDLEEALEDAWLVLAWDADTLVRHGQHHFQPLLRRSHGHDPAGTRELHRVMQQVEQQLPQPLGVAPDRWQRGSWQGQPDLDTLPVSERPEPRRPGGEQWTDRHVIEVQLGDRLLDA